MTVRSTPRSSPGSETTTRSNEGRESRICWGATATHVELSELRDTVKAERRSSSSDARDDP